MVDLIRGIDPELVRSNLERVRDEIAATGRDLADVEILAAVKYVPLEELDALVAGGVRLAGENRAQELERKATAHPDLTWDFIGHLQSRKVRPLLPLVRWIHSVATDSALRELAKHGTTQTEVLVEVNVADEEGKSGVAPVDLSDFLERVPCRVVGLMTMPPLARDAEDSRRWFATLAELGAAHGLRELSMGTSQDYRVAVEEGATILRLGSVLFR